MNKFLEGFFGAILGTIIFITLGGLFLGGAFLMSFLPYWWSISFGWRVVHLIIYIILWTATLVGLGNLFLGEDEENDAFSRRDGE